MAAQPSPITVAHGAPQLTAVTVDAYNAELRDSEGFVGDRASNRAFRAILEEWRERLEKVGDDPLGDTPTEDLSKKKLDKVLLEGDLEAAGVVYSAVEDFAQELATVTRRFLKLKAWQDTQRIAFGGGLRASRVGELAIARAATLVKADGHEVEMSPIHWHPDEAGLVGSVHLAPPWIFEGQEAILAVDIGGSNIRAGVVTFGKEPDMSACKVVESELWRHCDEDPKPKREEAVERIAAMLERLAKQAIKAKLGLAPFVGIACPGVIAADGSIERGGQNLPGNWESSRFNLVTRIRELMPTIGDHETVVIMHNDAVVQGLSEAPFMTDVEHWGILTIGTGLGNARFTNRRRKAR